ncbi:MAG: hypothetical protein IJM25_05895 [Eubacterium sp.]|nr:hypothetical protein [Eubacterium sp.]
MKEVIGVRFRKNGRVYYFDPRDNAVELGTKVIVETSKGIEYGWVVMARREVDEERIQGGLRPIQRLATEQDIIRYETNLEKSKRAYDICVQKIREHDLAMKLVSAEYAFDNNKVMFYFTADNRVDFRELVKDLASVFRTRIELRQIGVRDEARMCGGIGICGREFCCHSYLSDFIPVSIKMAKEQNLSLNPTKISGACGRLMCCLKHEQDTYEYLNSKLPNVGDRVTAYDGVTGEVASLNVLRQKVKIYVTDEEGNKELVEYRVEELVSGPRGRRFETDESLLDPELSQLEDDGEPGEEGRSAGGRHRRNRPENADGGQGRGARERSGREHGGRDRKEGGAKDRTEQRPERDGEKKERNRNNRDHSDRNRNRDGGRREGGRDGNRDMNREGGRDGNRDMNREGGRDGNRDMNREGGRDGNRDMNREGSRRGGDQNQAQNQQGQSKEQGGGQRSRRRHNRPNRKPEDKSQQ